MAVDEGYIAEHNGRNDVLADEVIINIIDLVKEYGRHTVLSGVNLQIKRGDSIAFTGHNGCGKSTLLKIIGGLLPFERGKAIYSRKLKFGYVPERFPPMNITAREYIKQIGSIAGLSPAEADKKGLGLFEALFMRNMAEMPIRYLSKGTIQKVAVVQAFLTTPDVLLLDEPVSGQDMASQEVFVDIVTRLNRDKNVTVLLACHEEYMVSAISRSVYEIIDGKLHEAKNKMKAVEGEKIYKLRFVKPRGYEIYAQNNSTGSIPEFVCQTAIKIDREEGRDIAVYVTAAVSSIVIREMLGADFELRGINNEIIT